MFLTTKASATRTQTKLLVGDEYQRILNLIDDLVPVTITNNQMNTTETYDIDGTSYRVHIGIAEHIIIEEILTKETS